MVQRLVFLYCFFLLFVSYEQVFASSSEGSVPDYAFKGKGKSNRHSRVSEHVPNTPLGESSANSLSPPKTKKRKDESSKGGSATSKQTLQINQAGNPSTDLRLGTSFIQSGPRNAIKREPLPVIGHARYRKLKPEAIQHGSKQRPIEILDHEGAQHQNERQAHLQKVQKHASGELMRQILAAKNGKKKAKTINVTPNSKLPDLKPPRSPSGSDGGGNGNQVDLSLRLRRRGLENGNGKKSVSIRLQLGSSDRPPTANPTPQSHPQRFTGHTIPQSLGQPRPTIQASSSLANQMFGISHRDTMIPIGGPIRRAGVAARLIAVYPSHTVAAQPSIDQIRRINAYRNSLVYGRQILIATSPNRSGRIAPVGTIQSAHTVAPLQQQPSHGSHTNTQASPGTQNLIDRVGSSPSFSRIQNPAQANTSNEHQNTVITDLSLGL